MLSKSPEPTVPLTVEPVLTGMTKSDKKGEGSIRPSAVIPALVFIHYPRHIKVFIGLLTGSIIKY